MEKSFMSRVAANQSEDGAQPEQEPKKSVFQMADDASEPDEDQDEAEEEEEEQEEEQEQEQEQEEEQDEKPKFDADKLVERFEKGEELTEEEEEFLVENGFAERTEAPEKDTEFTPPTDAEKLKQIFPDREFKSAEDFDNAREEFFERFNEVQAELNETKQTTQSIAKVLTENPEMQAIIKALDKGISVRAALIEAGFTAEDFHVLEDDDDKEDMIEAQVNAREQKRIREQQEAERNRNMAESEKRINSLQMDQQQKDKLYERVNTVFDDFTKGIIRPETLEMFTKALNYDSNVSKAVEMAKKEVRNEKIQLVKKRKQGDGMPRLVSKAVRTNKKVQSDPLIDQISQQAAQRPKSFLDRLKSK